MDPNLPQTPTSQQKSITVKIFSQRKFQALLIIVIIIIFTVAALSIYSPNLFRNKPQEPLQAIVPTSVITPTFIPVKLQTTRGIITKILNNSLTIKTGTNSATFDISKTKDFQKLVSGTLAGGDAKTATSSAKDLKAGQEVLVITINESVNAASVHIIK